ncbi:MAG: protein-L-isoaspartate(D-aspartate) O-methyltransferase [Chloracidobacterium sp.]|nr:protein-L-isoaspartate(D-aspartate) O-methyltransferase [Chloracidobacterium sp.]MCC6825656.1 protein-L-isoaspartate(D-aspartate) O-methyltransferase [Acidobacteriota bacterium]MCO5333771.1 protein-L-isoaspartate(D-aspartate) O-methyltransferase [Pyrinomonadaceae bacterium]
MTAVTPQKNASDGYEMLRHAMIDTLRSKYGIADEKVLGVMGDLGRHLFVPEALRSQAYRDNALPIAGGQTISQPFIVAKMTSLLELTGSEKVLEIGAGTGYQTAILATLARRVFAVERIASLAADAEQRLRSLGFTNVTIKAADGTNGWDAYQPYDAILVAAGGPSVPAPLVAQLKVGGRLVVPVGREQRSQFLIRVTRTANGSVEENFGPCSFVPLIGEHGW